MVSLYIPDDHSVEAANRMLSFPEPVLVSSLIVLEAANAMHLRLFRKERTVRQTAESIQAFEADLSAGVLRLLPVPASAWDVARRLSAQHSATLGTLARHPAIGDRDCAPGRYAPDVRQKSGRTGASCRAPNADFDLMRSFASARDWLKATLLSRRNFVHARGVDGR